MKKSLMAVALLGAFAGAAQAQTAVQIYGTVDAGVQKQTGQTLSIGKRAAKSVTSRTPAPSSAPTVRCSRARAASACRVTSVWSASVAA
jgi:predicted porin